MQCQTGWRKPNLGHLPTVCHGCADRYRGFGWGKHDSFGFRQGDSGPEIGCSCKSLAHGTRLPWSALGRVWDADPAPTSLQPWINHVIQLHALLLFALTFFFSFPRALYKHCNCCPPRCRNLLTRPSGGVRALTHPNIKMFDFHSWVLVTWSGFGNGSEQHFPSWFQRVQLRLDYVTAVAHFFCAFHSFTSLPSFFFFFSWASTLILSHDTAAPGLVALSSKSAALHHCSLSLLMNWGLRLCVCLCVCVSACVLPPQWVEELRSHGAEGGEQVPPWEEDRERILWRYLPRWGFELCSATRLIFVFKQQETFNTHISSFRC